MDIEVMQRYVAAFKRKINEGDRLVRHLSPREQEAYQALKEQTFYRYRLPHLSFTSIESLIADIDRTYERLLPFWEAARLHQSRVSQRELALLS